MRPLAIVAAVLLIASAAPVTAHASEPAAPRNTGISGTWIGTQKGFENGTFVSRQVRYTIAKAKGAALTGTKSWRDAGGTWSSPEPFQGVLLASGEFNAVDDDGYIFGELVTPTRIRGTYMEAGADQAVYLQDLRKATRS